jgi:hypothetical protein
MTQDELEKIKVLNLLVFLQLTVFSADDCSTIKWFNKHQTKMLLNRLNDTIQKEHGDALKMLWDEPGTNMNDVMTEAVKLSELISRVPFYRIPDINKLIEEYLAKEF